MAQFDVHRNLAANRQDIPFMVVVQSQRLDSYRHRLVVPLVANVPPPKGEAAMHPTFRVESVDVLFYPLQMAAVSVDKLGPKVASLATEGDRIIAAIDMVITRAWG